MPSNRHIFVYHPNGELGLIPYWPDMGNRNTNEKQAQWFAVDNPDTIYFFSEILESRLTYKGAPA